MSINFCCCFVWFYSFFLYFFEAMIVDADDSKTLLLPPYSAWWPQLKRRELPFFFLPPFPFCIASARLSCSIKRRKWCSLYFIYFSLRRPHRLVNIRRLKREEKERTPIETYSALQILLSLVIISPPFSLLHLSSILVYVMCCCLSSYRNLCQGLSVIIDYNWKGRQEPTHTKGQV